MASGTSVLLGIARPCAEVCVLFMRLQVAMFDDETKGAMSPP
jgi:hypothetical protein